MPRPLPPFSPACRRSLPRLPVALLLAIAIALAVMVPAPPAGASEARPRIDQESWLEWQVADAIADARRDPRSVDPAASEPSVPATTGWSDLRDVARRWSDAMASRQMMSHNPSYSDESCCWQKAGEILAQVHVGDDVSATDLAGVADRAVDAWFDSASHRSAMLDGRYDHLGVGVTVDHAAGMVWVAVNLRQTNGQPPGSAWYRHGDRSPATPAPGWACNSAVAPYGTTAWPLPGSSITRLAGDDRVDTALALSSDVDAPSTVLLAAAETPSDALAAAGLAGTHDAPVLLTGGRALDGRVVDQLRRWRPDEVVLLGGPAALSRRVAEDVSRAAPSTRVRRVQGPDRFATAAAIADRLADHGGRTGRVLLALGDHPDPSRSWADAVTVSGLAAAHAHPVLLTAPGRLPEVTRDALRRLSPSHVVVPGGPAAVSDAVLDQVRAAVPDARVDRVAGASRYETSRAVVALDQSLRRGESRRVHLVHGQDWPDALTAGPAAARGGGVLALVHGTAPGGGGPDMDHLGELSDRLRTLQVTLAGGTAAISSSRAAAIRDELHCL